MKQHHRVSAALFLLSLCFILAQGMSQHSTAHLDTHWYPGTATWYGEAEGDGSTGNEFLTIIVVVARVM
jgi:hypothetical protein